jgi:hypothetical protein
MNMNMTRRGFLGALFCALIFPLWAPTASAAVAVRQELVASVSTAATTVSVTFSTTPLLAGDCIDVFVENQSGNGTTTVSDSASNTYTQAGATITGSSRNLRQFVACNIVGGTLTVTATQVSSQDQFLIDAREISGTSGLDTGTGTPAGQYQSAPGTATNAITTGSGAGNLTPTAQPGLISGFLVLFNPGATNTVGTGFTQGVNEAAPGAIGGDIISESLVYSSLSAIPATFTTSNSAASSLTLAGLFVQAIPPTNAGIYNQLPLSQAVANSGPQFTVPSGCGTVSGILGGYANQNPVTGVIAGSFLAGSTTCVPVLTFPTSVAPGSLKNGWICGSIWDLTTPADTLKQTAYTLTTATLSGTVVTGDQIVFVCRPF